MNVENTKRAYVIQRSGWSAFSLLAYLILGIGVPVALVIFGDSVLGLGGLLPILIAAVWLIVSIITLIVLIHNAVETTYRWEGNVIVCENAKVFSGMSENKRFIFTPGMTVYIRQSLKGWIFGYGTVCITMGMATAGEFTMEHVKNPKDVKQYLTEYLLQYSYSPAYTSSPYIVNPYAYANLFPGFYGWGGYPFNYMMQGNGGAPGQTSMSFPYSAPYATAGSANPYNF